MSDDEAGVVLIRDGERVDLNELFLTCMADQRRLLADDEISTVVYVGDMGLHAMSGVGNPITGDPPPDWKGHWGQTVQEISVLRFPAAHVRRQIGSAVKSILEDHVFVIREAGAVRKVRARDLQVGMVLETGERVFL